MNSRQCNFQALSFKQFFFQMVVVSLNICTNPESAKYSSLMDMQCVVTFQTTLPVMGCRRILFEEAGPSAPSRDSADSPSPKRLEMNDMRVAVDVRNTEVPERSPPRHDLNRPSRENETLLTLASKFRRCWRAPALDFELRPHR